MKEITSPREFTRHRLLMAALKLFSEKGISSVRVHEIVSAADARNNAAVYYHFGNKDKLVEELFATIQNRFDEIRAPMIREAKKLARQERLTPDDVAEILIFPYVELIETEEWGLWATRFIARAQTDFTPQISKVVDQIGKTSAKSMANLLPRCLPLIPKKLLLSRFNFLTMAVIHGFAEYRSLNESYFGDLSYANLRQVAVIYKQCMVAALSAPANTQE